MAFRDYLPEPGSARKALGRKYLLTGFVVILFQALTHIPLPGIDSALRRAVSQDLGASPLAAVLNLLSGGGLANLSIMAVGLNGYITAGALVQAVYSLSPTLRIQQRDIPSIGERQSRRWTALLTLPVSIFSAYMVIWLYSGVCWSSPVLPQFGFGKSPIYTMTILAVLAGGALLAMLLARWIERDGLSVGDGTDVLLLAGITTGLPGELIKAAAAPQAPGRLSGWAALLVYGLVLVAAIVVLIYLHLGQRRIPILSPRMAPAQREGWPARTNYLPISLLLGKRGMLAGQSLVVLALLVSNLLSCSTGSLRQASALISSAFNPQSGLVGLVLFFPGVLFSYIYTRVTFEDFEIVDALRKRGDYIPGIHPGGPTQAYLSGVVRSLSWFPALILGLVVVLPWLVNRLLGLEFSVADGDNLLVLVATVSDAVLFIESTLIIDRYDGLIQKKRR